MEGRQEEGKNRTWNSAFVAPSGLQGHKERERESKGLASLADCCLLGRWLSLREEDFQAEPPQPLPPPWSFKQSGQPGKTGCKPQPPGPGEGAQVTAAPGNRFPGNRWQLQEGNYVTPRLRPSTAQAP